MDCFTFRVNIKTKSKDDDATLCIDAPYLLGDGPNLPDCFEDKIPVIENETADNPDNKRTELTENIQETQPHNVWASTKQKHHVGDEQCTKPTENTKETRSCDVEASIVNQNNQETCTGSTQTNAKSAIVKPSKQLLNEYYAKLHIKADKINYTTIKHDKMVKFASVFTCPNSGEIFMGGRVKNVEYTEEDGLLWFGKCFS